MHTIRTLVVLLALVLLACPPVRENVDGSGEGGLAFRNGALVYTDYSAGYGYYWAVVGFRAEEGTVTCEEWVEIDFDFDQLEGEWIVLYLYRGEEREWEQTYYGLYDYEDDCGAADYDYSDLRCAVVYTDESTFYSGVEAVVTSWTDGRVRGSLVADGIEAEFDVDNCGPWSYYGYYDGRSDESGGGGGDSSGWRLRLR